MIILYDFETYQFGIFFRGSRFFWKTKQSKNLEFIWAVIALTSLSSKATFSGINRVVEPKNRAGLHYSFLWGISWHCNACSIFYIFQPQKEFRLIKKLFLRGSPLCTYFCCFMKSPEPLWLHYSAPIFWGQFLPDYNSCGGLREHLADDQRWWSLPADDGRSKAMSWNYMPFRWLNIGEINPWASKMFT